MPCKERLRELQLFKLEKGGLKAACSVPARGSSRLYDTMVDGERVRNNECKLKLDIYTGYKENLFPYEDSQAVTLVSQRGGAVSVPGGFQDWTGKLLSNLA